MKTDRQCTIGDCIKPLLARGMCNMHYYRQRTYGDPNYTKPKQSPQRDKTCSMDGCEKLCQANNYCSMHYQRARRHGDPNTVFPRRNNRRP